MNLPRLITLVLTLGLGVSTAFAELELVRVWPGYRDAASFTSASEYFQGAAAKSNQLAKRSQPEARDGYYWLIRSKTPVAISAAKIRLEVTRTGSTEPSVYEFDADLASGSHAIPVGLTGSDWVDATEVPVAWRLTIFSREGSTLATKSSFLWQVTTD